MIIVEEIVYQVTYRFPHPVLAPKRNQILRWLVHQSFGDALYMTAITLSAVGYNEVFPLSVPGRVFTMLLLLAGITWLGFWFANLTSLIVELDLKDALRRRRSMKEIAKILNIKENSARVAVQRSREKLKAVLQEQHDR